MFDAENSTDGTWRISVANGETLQKQKRAGETEAKRSWSEVGGTRGISGSGVGARVGGGSVGELGVAAPGRLRSVEFEVCKFFLSSSSSCMDGTRDQITDGEGTLRLGVGDVGVSAQGNRVRDSARRRPKMGGCKQAAGREALREG